MTSLQQATAGAGEGIQRVENSEQRVGRRGGGAGERKDGSPEERAAGRERDSALGLKVRKRGLTAQSPGSSAGRAAHRPVCVPSWLRGERGAEADTRVGGLCCPGWPSAELSRAAFFRAGPGRLGLGLQTGAEQFSSSRSPSGPWDPAR